MTVEILKSLFTRDLNKLKIEIESYENESKIWSVDKSISNSAGNLCLHLIGNLNSFIGTHIGKTSYVRNRELEFSNKNISKNILIAEIETTIQMINETFNNLIDEDLKLEYPIVIFESKMSTEYFFIHLTTHLAYHLGQINYHRRLLDN